MGTRALAGLGVLVAGLLAASPAGAEEPPGLDGRATHHTVLTTTEDDCVEIAIPRAVLADRARELVPSRYGLLVGGGGAASLTEWDYACTSVSVDGQRRAKPAQMSLGAVRIATRDQLPVPDSASYYLVWAATDDPVLLARWSQLGLPASPLQDAAWSASDPGAQPYTISFSAGGPLNHTATSVTPAAPVVVPTPGPGNLRFYAESEAAGEVQLSYHDGEMGSAPAAVTADFTQHSVIAPIIALPRLLTIAGAPFTVGSTRGSWSTTVVRTD